MRFYFIAVILLVLSHSSNGFCNEIHQVSQVHLTRETETRATNNILPDLVKQEANLPPLSLYECENPKSLNQQSSCEPLISNFLAKESLKYTKYNLLVTFLGVLFSGSGLYFIWRTLRNAEKAFRIENRAYIKHEFVEATIKVGYPITTQWKVINYGKTQAIKVINATSVVIRGSNWWWDDEDSKKTENPELRNELDGTIHPSDSGLIFDERNDCIITKDIEVSLQNNNSVLYFRFLTIYTDLFGAHHEITTYLEFSGSKCYEKGIPRFSKVSVEVRDF